MPQAHAPQLRPRRPSFTRSLTAVLAAVVWLLAAVTAPVGNGALPTAGAATNFTVTSTPSVTTLPYGGGPVTYTYTVTNTSSSNLYYEGATDSVCSPVSYSSGMSRVYVSSTWSYKYRLSPGSTATFTCTRTIGMTTTNTVTFTFATGYHWLFGTPQGVQSGSASSTVTMTNDASGVCSIGTIWGNVGGWGGATSTAYKYTVNADGTLTYANVTMTMPSSTGADIAISPDGTKMYSITGTGVIREYDISSGSAVLRRTITVTGIGSGWTDGSNNTNVINSLSFGPNGKLYFGGQYYTTNYSGGNNNLYMVDVTSVVQTPTQTITATVAAAGTSVVPYGYAGDFITLPDGRLLGLANTNGAQTNNPTKFVIFTPKNDGSGTFNAPVDAGMPSLPSGIRVYGATFANGSLWLAGSDGQWYRMDAVPTVGGSTYPVTALNPDGRTTYWGATGSQEANAQCASPSIDLRKSKGTVTGPTGSPATYTATYTLSVVNTSTTRSGTYSMITDYPQFDSHLTPTGASWTGQTSGSATGAGPYAITTTTLNIAAGATHTYNLSVTFTFDGEGAPSACTTTAGTGLFNTVSLPASSEVQATNNNTACDDPTVPWLTIAKSPPVDASGNPVTPTTGPDTNGVYTTSYTVTVANSSTATRTFGALTDTPAFDPNLTVTGASWTSTSSTPDGSGNPVTTAGPYSGSATGTGPFTLAPAGSSIAAKTTYSITVKITYTYSGAGTAAACGAAGTGLYNAIALPAGQEQGTDTDNATCIEPPTKPAAASINIAKTAGTVSGPDAAGNYTATYTVTAKNSGTAAGTYGPITDTPQFASNLVPTAVSWTRNGTLPATVVSNSAGPYTLGSAGTSLAIGAQDTYAVTITFHYTNRT